MLAFRHAQPPPPRRLQQPATFALFALALTRKVSTRSKHLHLHPQTLRVLIHSRTRPLLPQERPLRTHLLGHQDPAPYSSDLGKYSTWLAWQETCSGKTRNHSTVTNLSTSLRRRSSHIVNEPPIHLCIRLVDLFSTLEATPNSEVVRRSLLESYSPLQSAQLTNSVLSSLSLPRTLDPHKTVGLPSRLFTLLVLIRDSLASLIRLPFFILPLIVHFPAYSMSWRGWAHGWR